MARTEKFARATNISSSAPFVEIHQRLASHVAAISPFVEQLMRFIGLFMKRFGMARNTETGIEIAISEALANAVIHGNHENAEKNVEVVCRCSLDGEVWIIVRDQGTGFKSSAIPDPPEPERPFLTSGRGLHLMRALMDEVSFDENGTVVRMRKRVNTPRG
jgi:serine/threonine-protein kinase RsbW